MSNEPQQTTTMPKGLDKLIAASVENAVKSALIDQGYSKKSGPPRHFFHHHPQHFFGRKPELFREHQEGHRWGRHHHGHHGCSRFGMPGRRFHKEKEEKVWWFNNKYTPCPFSGAM